VMPDDQRASAARALRPSCRSATTPCLPTDYSGIVQTVRIALLCVCTSNATRSCLALRLHEQRHTLIPPKLPMDQRVDGPTANAQRWAQRSLTGDGGRTGVRAAGGRRT
jgi:hypothetical protein